MRLFITAFLFTISLSVVAQKATTGKVLDANTIEPLVGANVYVKSNWQKGASTDLDGSFVINDLNTGDTLIISYVGYGEKEVVYKGKDDLVILLESNIQNIDEVVITAEKLVAEEFTYKKIERLEIYLNPSAKADPLLAINSLPSSTTLDESANISFRGSSPGETGMFFNNVPLYDFVRFSQLNGIGTFGIFNASMVDELLVFPGNPPLEYGNTTSGLVAIKTTEEIPEEAVKNATLSLASYGFFISQPINEKQSFTAFTNYQPTELIKAINTEALEDIDFNSLDLGMSYLNILNDKTVLKVFNYTLAEGYNFNYEVPTLSTDLDQRKRRNFTVTNLRHKRRNAEITFNSNLSFSNTQFGYADTDIEIDNFDGFGSLNYQSSFGDFRIKSGFAYDYRQQIFDGTFYTVDYAEGPGFPTSSVDATSELIRPELYTYVTYFHRDKWVFGGGIRRNIPVDNQSSFLSSQVNTKYALTDKSSLTFAIGNYYKYDFGITEAPVLNESKQISLDYAYTTNKLNVTASLFAKDARVQNVDSEIVGVEVFLQGKIMNKLRGQISYSLIDGISRDQEGIEYPNAFDLDYFIRGNLEWRLNGTWTLNSTFAFRQGSFYRPLVSSTFDDDLEVFEPVFNSLQNQERLPAYGIVDMSINKMIPISEKFSIIAFGTVNNVLNKENVRDYSYNFDYTQRSPSLFQQRTFYVGAVLNF